ncbi:MAG: DEAD/DEAH box helicase [Thermoguttaceae bacterium]
MTTIPSRDDLASRYLDQLPYKPYTVQEEALLAWFSAEQGVLVCTPTGTGKTLIAEAALFEALHTGTAAYYTTPLIALTEQKFREMQSAAVRWGFDPRDVGLVTGNRRENPDARVLVVVAEILLNRLLHTAAFDFSTVSAVVMDEFHSFTDPERGVVWELSLGLLPPHVRTLLLSATVGNATEFIHWLRTSHSRNLELVLGQERKVPLAFHWVGDRLLPEQIEEMVCGDADARKTPTLVFCFNRDECWTVAEQLKGKKVLSDGQQARLTEELKEFDWSQGAGPKLRQLLLRGVGVHHAGLLPKYRRMVEELFQRKLLSVAVCTETLSAGINLPARSVVLPNLLKGPPDKKKILEASSAQQIFGRAGRPQFDKQGYVYVLAHEDDVKLNRWREQFDRIPAETKDPGLLKARKALERKRPRRRETEQYWNEAQFRKLCAAPSGKLHSRGPLPWRLLSYMLDASPEVDRIRRLVAKRLMDSGHLEAGQRELDRMLLTLHRAGYVTLDPPPPAEEPVAEKEASPVAPRPRPRPTNRAWPLLRPSYRSWPCFAASIRFMPYFCSSSWALPIAASGSRPWKACWSCRVRWAVSRGCPSTTRCRPVRWPRCGWTMSCCNSAWRPWTSSPSSPATSKNPGDPAAATTPSRMRSPSGCSRWPRSCGDCSTISARASRTCGRNRSGWPATCWNTTPTSTATSRARIFRSRRGFFSAICCG